MSKAKLEAARELIKEKQYSEARAILRTLKEDPTAQRWLAKLNEIAPERRNPSVLPVAVAVVVLLVVLLVALVIVLVGRQSTAVAVPTAQTPTLAVLPSETASPVSTATLRYTQTNTLTPSATPTSSNTFTPTLTPSRTHTPEPPCDAQVWWDEVEPIIVDFLDTAEIAGQTSRVSLSPLLLEMRRIYRRYEDVERPLCIREAYYNLLFGMDSALEGYGNFQMEYEVLMQIDFGLANAYLYAAGLVLRSKGIFPDIRLSMSDVIWGGDQANDLTATAISATSTPTPTIGPTPLPTNQVAYTSPSVRLQLHAGPSTNTRVIAEIEPNTQVTVIRSNVAGDWYFVHIDPNWDGWLMADFVK